MFIVVCGADGVGKNTQSKRLVAALERTGREAALISFPRYDTPLGKAILRHLKREIVVANGVSPQIPADGPGVLHPAPEDAMIFQTMMVADKYDAAPVIEDHIKAGNSVVCDRYWQSAFAYGGADGLNQDWFLRAHSRLPQADLNILLQVPLEEARRRRPVARDRYESDFVVLQKVRDNYAELWGERAADYTKPGRWVVIDGIGTEDEVHERIWSQVIRTWQAMGKGFREQLDGGAP